jgi:hypothetical protein
MPPDTDGDFLDEFPDAVEQYLFAQTLTEAEMRLSLVQKRKLANAALAARNERLHGRLYCIVNQDVPPRDGPELEIRLRELASHWPRVRFVELDDSFDRKLMEKTVIWALKDYLREGS